MSRSTVAPDGLRGVVTYGSASGSVDVAPECATRLRAAGCWPRDANGQEMCDVEMGLHDGYCQCAECR